MKTNIQSTTSSSAVSRIHIAPPAERDGRIYWEGELRLPSGECHRIYFDFTAPARRPELRRPRPFLLAFLLPAMHAGAPLELDLPVDAVTRNNLMEWQEAMASWNPKVFKVVPIVAPLDERPVPAGEPGALTAFSGGVDSSFTLCRHGLPTGAATFRKTALRAGLMVHGFDIPLADEAVFERAFQRSRATLEGFGLEAFRLKTNLRTMDRVPGCDWEKFTHGIWLAAALACYEPWFGQIVIPSTYPYPVLRFPWGSNPVTDPLFSSAATAYWHDGTAYSKLTKVQAIAGQDAIRRNLRVCWEGEQLDRNCGHCFKCITTQVCFQLAGFARLAAFPEPCTLAQVARIPVRTEQNAWLLRAMSAEARRQGLDPVARALDQALVRAAAKQRRLKIKQRLRRWIRFRFR
jgi:hypothetical protein